MFRLPALALLLCAGVPAAAAGALVIAGGAIADDNAAIVRALLDRRPPGAPAIAIIPAASAVPAESFARTRDLFVRHGADPAEIRLIRLASVDDPGTAEDESGWARNAASAAELTMVADAGAIWFTGGDQTRILATLLRPDGSETPLLVAIRARHRDGAVIGGTSAGAAIMSDPMLTGGDPIAAVAPARGEPVATGRGLGFLRGAMVDQHFDTRDRLPRLLAVLARLPKGQRLGFGIAEDTALIVDEDGRGTVAGRGLVTMVDARRARLLKGPGLAVEGVGLRFLTEGASLMLPAEAGP